MPPPAEPRRARGPVVISVPEVRDYREINALVVQALDAGASLVRLEGVERQRLLVYGLRGGWEAVVEVDGRAGPELASALDAPGLRVVCTGSADDGAGLGLRAGRLLVLGACGDAVGYAQRGGVIVAAAGVGHRAGLDRLGGLLIVAGRSGRLLGERQSGGRLIVLGREHGPHAGLGLRGGRLVAPWAGVPGFEAIEPEDRAAVAESLLGLENYLPADFYLELGPTRMDGS